MTAIDDAAAAVRAGTLIVFPTDTVYGLACLPDDPAATDRVFELKERPKEFALAILVPSTAAAKEVAVFDERAERLASALWPGALTIVLPRSEVSQPWELGGEDRSIGVRVPRHPLALAVLRATGPLAVTSANRSGEPPARSSDELHAAFGDRVAVYLCQDDPLGGEPSTVIDLAHGDAQVGRVGSIEETRLRELLGAEVPLLDSPPPKVTPSR